MKLEAAWALSNIVSGTEAQTQVVVDKGAIIWLIKLLSSNNEELREQVRRAMILDINITRQSGHWEIFLEAHQPREILSSRVGDFSLY